MQRSGDASLPAPRGERDGRRYRVWFATNREPVQKDDLHKGFSVERSAGEVYHGTCDVFVPRTHRIGSLGSPWWKRFWRRWDDPRRDDPLRLLQIDILAEDQYWLDLARAVATVPSNDRRATVFLHGYNVSFASAALRTAQIAADLKVRGPMCFFSWPSHNEMTAYVADEAAIEASERAIFEFLVGIAERSGASRVDVIAHSMGNRGLGRAVQRILANAEACSAVRFGHFILAAPDADCDTFREVAQRYGELAQRTTRPRAQLRAQSSRFDGPQRMGRGLSDRDCWCREGESNPHGLAPTRF
jgi:esterase/lipase superfamily enzyme